MDGHIPERDEEVESISQMVEQLKRQIRLAVGEGNGNNNIL